MLTLDDIINASFGKASFSAGYRTEDVDEFLDEVKESYEELLHKYTQQRESLEELKKENASLTEKVDVLVDSVEKYREEENDSCGCENRSRSDARKRAQRIGDAAFFCEKRVGSAAYECAERIGFDALTGEVQKRSDGTRSERKVRTACRRRTCPG